MSEKVANPDREEGKYRPSDDCSNIAAMKTGLRRLFFAILIILGLIGTGCFFFLSYHTDPTELFIFSARKYSSGNPASMFIMVRNAKDKLGESGKHVQISLHQAGIGWKPLPDIVTGSDGTAIVNVGELSKGHYKLKAVCNGFEAKTEFDSGDNVRSILTTDKPIYKPGQPVRLRTLTLNSLNLCPVNNPPEINIKIKDSRDNLVYDKTQKASKYGIVSGELKLADQVITGDYTVTAQAGDNTVSSLIKVKHYRLPSFTIKLKENKDFYTPGDTIEGTVSASYIWGKPLAGAEVKINPSIKVFVRQLKDSHDYWTWRKVYETVEKDLTLNEIKGKTDHSGEFKFSIKLPGANGWSLIDFASEDSECNLKISVSDVDKTKMSLDRKYTVSDRPLRVKWLPEFGRLLPGMARKGFIAVTDPDSRPVIADISIGNKSLRTSGIGVILTELPGDLTEIKVTDVSGNKIIEKLKVNYDNTPNQLLLTTDKAIYSVGEVMHFRIRPELTGVAYIDFVKDDYSVKMFPVELKGGQSSFSFRIPEEIFGVVRIHAYLPLPTGSMVQDMRLVRILKDNKLKVSAVFNKPVYRPGDNASLNLQLKDQAGNPVRGAVGLSMTDDVLSGYRTTDEISISSFYNSTLNNICISPVPVIKKMFDDGILFRKDRDGDVRYFLENKYSLCSIQLAAGESYNDRENRLNAIKVKFGDYLALAVILPLLMLTFIWFLIMVKKYGGDPLKTGYVVFSDQDNNDAQRLLNRYILFLIFIVFISLAFLVMNRIMTHYRVLMPVHLGLPVLVILAFLYSVVKRYKGKLEVWLKEYDAEKAFEGLLIIPYAISILLLCMLVINVIAVLFPNATGILVYTFLILALAVLFTAVCNAIKNMIFTKGILEARISSASLGEGIGSNSDNNSKLVLYWLLIIGPVMLFYGWFMLSVLSMFLPFCRVIEKLDGGGGGSGFRFPASHKSEFFAEMGSGKAFCGLGTGENKNAVMPYIRRNFPETLLWMPQVITDDNGKARIDFNVADAITKYSVKASANTLGGLLGDFYGKLSVYQNFFIDFKPPRIVTHGDIISLPVKLYNYLDKPQEIKLFAKPGKAFAIEVPDQSIQLQPQTIKTVYLKVKFIKTGVHKLQLVATGTRAGDALERDFEVRPDGRMVEATLTGLVTQGECKFDIPEKALPGGRDFYIKLYPSPLPQIKDNLKVMLRMPHGCFEQTISAAFPNIMIIKYLDKSGLVDEKLVKRCEEFIQQGYQNILTFEDPGGGFRWYSHAKKSNVALSAYALDFFNEMRSDAIRKIYPVGDRPLKRTLVFLNQLQYPDGSWHAAEGGEASLALTSYIARVINRAVKQEGQSGYKVTLERAYNYIVSNMDKCKDPYTLSLCAAFLVDYNKTDAVNIIRRLEKMAVVDQYDRAHWKSTGQGMFRTTSYASEMETTASIVDSMIKLDINSGLRVKAIFWLYYNYAYYDNRGMVSFMRLLSDNPVYFSRFFPNRDFAVELVFNGESKKTAITPKNFDVTQYIQYSDRLRNGGNKIIINAPDRSMTAYKAGWRYYMPWPPEKKVKSEKFVRTLEVFAGFDRQDIKVGDSFDYNLCMVNNAGTTAPMGMVSIPVPPGCGVDMASVQKLQDAGVVDNFSVQSDMLTLYLKEFKARSKQYVSIKLNAEYPVEVTARPVKIYPYYQPANFAVAIPAKLRIAQRAKE